VEEATTSSWAGRVRTGSAAVRAETRRAPTPPTRSAPTAKWSRGLPSPAPPPAPTPPPPTPPTPPPAAPTAKAGHYCGFTNQGKSICFDATGTAVANFETTSDVDCGIGILPDVSLSFGGSTQIQSDLSFSFTFNGPLQTGSGSAITNVTTSYTVSGKLDTAGNATGRLNLNRFSFDYQGTHYDCAAAGYAWQAKLGA
jgi:hypothetical protein